MQTFLRDKKVHIRNQSVLSKVSEHPFEEDKVNETDADAERQRDIDDALDEKIGFL